MTDAKADKITIERETVERAIDALSMAQVDLNGNIYAGVRLTRVVESLAALRAALAAQPAEPVVEVHPHHLRPNDVTGGHWCREVLLYSGNSPHDWLDGKNTRVKLYAAPPAPAAVPLTDEMDKVASRYAHKMALDLECILAEYGGSWYNTAMQTLGEYRSAMNAIHERESPTFMGEPVIAAAAGDKP